MLDSGSAYSLAGRSGTPLRDAMSTGPFGSHADARRIVDLISEGATRPELAWLAGKYWAAYHGKIIDPTADLLLTQITTTVIGTDPTMPPSIAIVKAIVRNCFLPPEGRYRRGHPERISVRAVAEGLAVRYERAGAYRRKIEQQVSRIGMEAMDRASATLIQAGIVTDPSRE